MNLDGVTGDSRKRLLAAAALRRPQIEHSECVSNVGQRDYHSHVARDEDGTRQLLSVPRD